MSKFSVIVIEPNRINYSEFDMNFNRLSFDKLKDDIYYFSELMFCNSPNNMMELIINKLNLNNDESLITSTIYEDDKYIYQICHKDCFYSDKFSKMDKNRINNIGNYLLRNNYISYDNVVVLKAEILSSGETINRNLSIDELTHIFRKLFVHKSVKIDTNSKMIDFEFINNPTEFIINNNQLNNKFNNNIDYQLNNWKFIETQIYDKIFSLFVQIKPDNNYINYYASLLYGSRINGDVIISMRLIPENMKEYYEYVDIDSSLLYKLICLISSDNSLPKIDIKENLSLQNNFNSIKLINNFYTQIIYKYNFYKSKNGDNVNTNKLKNFENISSINDNISKDNQFS